MVSLLVKLWIVIMSAVKSAKLEPGVVSGHLMGYFEHSGSSQVQVRLDQVWHTSNALISWTMRFDFWFLPVQIGFGCADTFLVFNDLGNVACVF